jgi:hypothetical protein
VGQQKCGKAAQQDNLTGVLWSQMLKQPRLETVQLSEHIKDHEHVKIEQQQRQQHRKPVDPTSAATGEKAISVQLYFS